MKKNLLGFLLLALTVGVKAQTIFGFPQLPTYGVVMKNQLWNMAIYNAGVSSIEVEVQVMLSDASTGVPVLSGASRTMLIAPGMANLSAADFQPIRYTVLSPGYGIDASAGGLMPTGGFLVCHTYSFNDVKGGLLHQETCEDIVVESLSPPQLMLPYDSAIVEELNPLLSWIPPFPVTGVQNVRYNLDLVEVYPTQTGADAVQNNLPVYHAANLSSTSLIYPATAQALQYNKLYAWRVTAFAGGMPIGQTDTWCFRPMLYEAVDTIRFEGDRPFAKLSRDNESYAVFAGDLKFDYLNEGADSVWRVFVTDLSTEDRDQMPLNMDTIPLQTGRNLVTYPVTTPYFFKDRHLYLLEIIDNKNVLWRLRFEFRKKEE